MLSHHEWCACPDPQGLSPDPRLVRRAGSSAGQAPVMAARGHAGRSIMRNNAILPAHPGIRSSCPRTRGRPPCRRDDPGARGPHSHLRGSAVGRRAVAGRRGHPRRGRNEQGPPRRPTGSPAPAISRRPPTLRLGRRPAVACGRRWATSAAAASRLRRRGGDARVAGEPADCIVPEIGIVGFLHGRRLRAPAHAAARLFRGRRSVNLRGPSADPYKALAVA